jgi:hypothetical protein
MTFGPYRDTSYFERMERLQAQAARAEEAARLVAEIYAKGRTAFNALIRRLKPANDDDAGRHAA